MNMQGRETNQLLSTIQAAYMSVTITKLPSLSITTCQLLLDNSKPYYLSSL